MMWDLSMYSSWGWFALLASVGVVFVVHGWAKVKNPSGIAGALGVPKFAGTIHGVVEVLAGLALITDMYVQLAGLVISVIMVGAIYFKVSKWKIPFWAQNNTGWEFDLVLLGAGLYFFLS